MIDISTKMADGKSDPRKIHKEIAEGFRNKGIDSGTIGKIVENQVRQFLIPDDMRVNLFAGAGMPDILYDYAGITLVLEVKTGCAILGRRDMYGKWVKLHEVDIVIYSPEINPALPIPDQMYVFTRREFLQMWDDLGLIRYKVSTQVSNEYKRIYGTDARCSTDEYADMMTIQTFSNSGKKNATVLHRCSQMPCLTNGGIKKIKNYAEMIHSSDTPEADFRRLEHGVKRLRQLLDAGISNEEAYWLERTKLILSR